MRGPCSVLDALLSPCRRDDPRLPSDQELVWGATGVPPHDVKPELPNVCSTLGKRAVSWVHSQALPHPFCLLQTVAMVYADSDSFKAISC